MSQESRKLGRKMTRVRRGTATAVGMGGGSSKWQQHQKDHMGEMTKPHPASRPARCLRERSSLSQAHTREEDKDGRRHGADVGREIAVKRDVQSAGALGEEEVPSTVKAPPAMPST